MEISRDQLMEAGRRALAAGDVQTAMAIKDRLSQVDVEGAPAGVRARVGNARSQADRLTALQQSYPDASMQGDGMVYTDEQGQRVLYNKPGFQMSDLAEYARVVPEAVGAGVGMAAGLPFGPAGAVGGAGFGGAFGGNLYDLAMGTPDTRHASQKATDVLTDVVGNAIVGPTPVNRVAEDVARGVSIAGPGAGDGMDVSTRAVNALESRRAAEKTGAKLSAGQMTGNKWFDQIENMVEANPLSGPVIQQQREDAAEAIGDYLGEATHTRPGTKESAGMFARDSVKQADEALRIETNRKYEAIEDTFRAHGNSVESPIEIPRLLEANQSYTDRVKRSGPWAGLTPDSIQGRLAGIVDEAGGPIDMPRVGASGNLITKEPVAPSYDTIKQYRTWLYPLKKDPHLAGSQGSSAGTASHLYGRASDDLEAAAGQLGGDEGILAREVANLSHDKRQTLAKGSNPYLKKSDSGLFNKAQSAFKNDPGQFKQLMNAMQPQDREPLIAQIVYEMGQAIPNAQLTGQDFSAATFMTNLHKMAPESRDMLPEGIEESIKNVTEAAKRLKIASKNTNRSKTPLGNAGLAMAGAMGLGVLSPPAGVTAAVAGGVVPWAIAHLINTPAATALASTPAGAIEIVNRLGAAGISNPGTDRQ